MKTGTILKHYMPCLYFIFLSLCIAYKTYNSPPGSDIAASNNMVACAVMTGLFLGLLFFRRTYARMIVGLLMLILSLYFSLAWLDAMVDANAAGSIPTRDLRYAIYYIGVAICMSILLIIPLHLPAKAPLYNRK